MRNEQSSSCSPEEARNTPEEVPPGEAHSAPEEVIVKSILSRIMKVLDESLEALEEVVVLNNEEISILYNYSRDRWNRDETVINTHLHVVATQISKENDLDDCDTESRTISDSRQRKDWPNEKVPSKQC